MKFSTTKNENSCCDTSTDTNCCDTTQSSDCGCSSTPKAEHTCPHCKEAGLKISEVTLKAQLKKEHYSELKNEANNFNFCKNPACDTVYYSNDGSESYNQSQVKSKITVKNDDPKTPLCYCKKLLKRDVIKMIEDGEENISTKIKTKISEGKTFCEKANPKGSCCTSEIKSFLKNYNIEF